MLNMLLRLFTRLMIKGGAKAGEAIGKAAAMPSVVRSVREAYGEDGVAVFNQAYAQSKDFQIAQQAVGAWAERKEAFDNPPALHGSARFAHLEEIEAEGLVLRGSKAATSQTLGPLYLGQFANVNDMAKPQYASDPPFGIWDDVGTLVTVAPSRSGKGARMIIPTLFFYKGSAIVIDPKSEAFDATARHRVQMGPVYRLDPFGEHTNAFNPLTYVNNATDAKQLADVLFVSQSTGDGKFHDDMAQTFLRALILYVKDTYPKDQQTLATVRSLTRKLSNKPNSEGQNLLADMATCGNPVIEAAAEDVIEGSNNAVTNLRSSYASQLGIWDEPSMQAVTARADFAFEDLKEQSATVYVVIPIDQLETASPLVRVLVQTALKGLTKTLGELDPPVLMVLDEFLSFGRIDPLLNSLTYLAGYGVRPWLLLQDTKTAKEIYGERFESVYTQAAVRSYFGVDDPDSCKRLSEELGTRTVAVDNSSHGFSGRGDQASVSRTDNISYQPRPLWTPDEVKANMTVTFEDKATRMGVHFVRGLAYPTVTYLTHWKASEIAPMASGAVFYAPITHRHVFAEHKQTFHTRFGEGSISFDGWNYKGHALGQMRFEDGVSVIVVDLKDEFYLGRFAWWWQAFAFIDWMPNITGDNIDAVFQEMCDDDMWFSAMEVDGSYRTS